MYHRNGQDGMVLDPPASSRPGAALLHTKGTTVVSAQREEDSCRVGETGLALTSSLARRVTEPRPEREILTGAVSCLTTVSQ